MTSQEPLAIWTQAEVEEVKFRSFGVGDRGGGPRCLPTRTPALGCPHKLPPPLDPPRLGASSGAGGSVAWCTLRDGVGVKDTVLGPLPVLGPWHVQQDQLGVLGLVEDDTAGVKTAVCILLDVGLVPGGGRRTLGTSTTSLGPAHSAPQEGQVGTGPDPSPERPQRQRSPQGAVRRLGAGFHALSTA